MDEFGPSPWAHLRAELPFRTEGGVDWAQRPFAKRWSARRLGRQGILSLAGEHVPLDRPCWLARSDSDEERETTLGDGLETAFDGDREGFTWLVDPRGRWLVELSPEGTFTFEFVDARHTRMLERLQAVERRWEQGG